MNKTYTIQGRRFTLAEVTPKRFAAYSTMLGISDFEELQKPETQKKLNAAALNIFKSPIQVKEMMSICLREDVLELSFDDFPATIFNEVMNDFFSQLLTS
ncbi:MAG: hypothetical protein AB1600_00315 [Bacteroidota bacterium]